MSATLTDYRRLLADRPDKFTGPEASYTPESQNKSDYACEDCLHFFTGKAARRRVCEVVRLQPERSIEPRAKCKFWTHTGERFPLLNSKD